MQSRSGHARLVRVLFGIQSSLQTRIDLASLARKFGASPFHFHRLFLESTGETPRQYVERLRLERALLRLALTNESITEIGHAVGFRNRETFSRSFRRRYRFKPIEGRQFVRWRSEKQPRTLRSQVRFESLPTGFLLAKRRVGDCSRLEHAPFTKQDQLWNPLVRWAARHAVRHANAAWGLTYDIPGVTPPEVQRFDGCIRIEHAVPGSRDIQCVRFDGGDYAMLDHTGDASTTLVAFAQLADVVGPDAGRYAWREGPFLTVYARPGTTTVCFPVSKRPHSKKRHGFARCTR